MKIIECVQGSPEWWEAHRGIPSSSDFDKIMTPAKIKMSAQADDLIDRLIGDRFKIGSIAPDGYISPAMRNGTLLEPEARRWYEMERDVTVKEVGFCIDDAGRFGCSPDALVGDDGLLELKAPQPNTQAGYIRRGELPLAYKCQVHGQLLVTGRKWVDFVSYCPPMPNFMIRVEPDDFTKALAACLNEFWTRYQEALALFTPKNHPDF